MSYRFFFLILTVFVTSSVRAEDAGPNAINDVNFAANYYPTAGQSATKAKKYGVIVLTGSAGGYATSYAKKIASMGFPVLSLAYFAKDIRPIPLDHLELNPPLPDTLEMIPLEYFDAPKQWLADRAETRNDGVIIIGYSKGAELALVLAAHDPQYKGVIAVAPSSVVWSGIPNSPTPITSASSSWSLNGKPLAFVPYIARDTFRNAGTGLYSILNWHIASIASVSDAKAMEAAFIEVENIRSPLLLLSGGKDTVWPSNEMATYVCNRVNAIKDDGLCSHLNFENAPHLLGDATADADQEIARFLRLLNQPALSR